MPDQPEQSESDYLTPGDAARIAGLTPKQLSRLADDGKVRFIRPGTHRRYLGVDISALVASRPWDAA